MALIDELRALDQEMPPSHTPTGNEIPQLLGALIAYVEHGDKFVKAASDEDPMKLANLLGGTEESAKDEPATSKSGTAPPKSN